MNPKADQVRQDFDEARKRISNSRSGRLRFHRFDGTGYWQYRFRSAKTGTDGVSFEELVESSKESSKAFSFFYSCSDITRKNSLSKPPQNRLHLRAKLAGSAKKLAKSITYLM